MLVPIANSANLGQKRGTKVKEGPFGRRVDGGSGSTFVTETAPAEPPGRDATRPEWPSSGRAVFLVSCSE